MHSIAFVLLPRDVVDIRGTTKLLLAPYHTELEVPPYKAYLSDFHLKHWAEKLGTSDLQVIASQLRLPRADVFVDDVGIYEITTHNKRGRFDSWGAKALFESTPASLQVGEDLSRSLCLVSQLPENMKSAPFSVITPEGEWFWAIDFGVKPIYAWTERSHLNREADARWKDEVRKLLTKYSDCLVFALDVHS